MTRPDQTGQTIPDQTGPDQITQPKPNQTKPPIPISGPDQTRQAAWHDIHTRQQASKQASNSPSTTQKANNRNPNHAEKYTYRP